MPTCIQHVFRQHGSMAASTCISMSACLYSATSDSQVVSLELNCTLCSRVQSALQQCIEGGRATRTAAGGSGAGRRQVRRLEGEHGFGYEHEAGGACGVLDEVCWM